MNQPTKSWRSVLSTALTAALLAPVPVYAFTNFTWGSISPGFYNPFQSATPGTTGVKNRRSTRRCEPVFLRSDGRQSSGRPWVFCEEASGEVRWWPEGLAGGSTENGQTGTTDGINCIMLMAWTFAHMMHRIFQPERHWAELERRLAEDEADDQRLHVTNSA